MICVCVCARACTRACVRACVYDIIVMVANASCAAALGLLYLCLMFY